MGSMSTQTITEFLEARIADDEAVARGASTGPWFRDSGWSISAPSPEGWDGPYVVVETPRARNDSAFIASHDPARVLAECAAKRAIIEYHAPVKDEGWISGKDHDYLWCGFCGSIDDSPEPYPCPTLKILAAVYADHHEFQQEWKL